MNPMKPLLGFLSVFLLGLVSGVSFSHLLRCGPKATRIELQAVRVDGQGNRSRACWNRDIHLNPTFEMA